ncbi:hypothetical protein J3R80_16320 [Aliiroseovarius sp. Z3]|uniref:aspartate/glutamate racemase family protein n=1 Tax=Aliiroseovarius sp. Z3 TaxID=2811402 RepID=UPI0023B29DAC|nr:aspartate/glutamate racemase family protein [Aliiroseovarius sp. Z3]MDE9451882.1 hypothetical protein [Aliiroseovarius sp. Z3]MDE9452040.1 hypothetical protein [Aliiroseovarius sp. Z3]
MEVETALRAAIAPANLDGALQLAGRFHQVRAADQGSGGSDGVTIEALTGEGSPASNEGHFDEAMSVPSLVRHVRASEASGSDGFVVACFDDPGIGACREVASGPVLGIVEALVGAGLKTSKIGAYAAPNIK